MVAVWHRRSAPVDQEFQKALLEEGEEPLEKAAKGAVMGDHGSWAGLAIIAIGPKGGKIVGYDTKGKPVYAGSKSAYQLAAAKTAKGAPSAKSVLDWLTQLLGLPAKLEKISPTTTAVVVTETVGALLQSHFPALQGKGHKVGSLVRFDALHLTPYIGQPLKPPTPGAQLNYAAKAAAGELENDPFPPLNEMQEIPAGVLAGSHGNKAFKSKDGRKWVFKHDSPIIARAEEAADRIARLILGAGKAPAAKYVKLAGKSGTLIEFLPGSVLNDDNHSAPPLDVMQTHFDEVVRHHVVDWLISNHDGHAGNFLVTPAGLAAFDKGQAWKFIGDDELSANYSPNASKPIYVRFWNALKDGSLKGDPIAAAAKAVNDAEKITPEQFEAIVAPYVAAKVSAGEKVDLTAKLLGRLKSLRTDWEQFLTKQLGKPVTLPKEPGADNFETMPEPDAVPVLTDDAKEPPVEKPAAGWPQTKGTATIHHPGTPPPPSAKWPKGYPGPGFIAAISYKGQPYRVEFMLHGGKQFGAFVTYPDGTVREFESPNDASDSLVLYHRKLPLDMTATERKKLAISYPAGVAFGIKKFAQELAQAHTSVEDSLAEKEAVPTAPPPPPPAGPANVDIAPTEVAVMPPVTATVNPTQLKDKVMAAPIGAIAYTNGNPTFKKIGYDEWTALDTGHPYSSFGVTQTNLTAVESPADLPPQPIVPQIPPLPEAPPITQIEPAKGPMAVGASKAVTKQFVQEDGSTKAVTVKLTKGFSNLHEVIWTVAIGDATKEFKSISSAARWAFMRQKGFTSPEQYENVTGKKLPGVSWAYFGLSPENAPANEPAIQPATKPTSAPATPAAAPDSSETKPATNVTKLPKKPSASDMAAMPTGTTLSWWAGPDGLAFAERLMGGSWAVKLPNGHAFPWSASELASVLAKPEVDEVWSQPPGGEKELPVAADLSSYAQGTEIHFDFGGAKWKLVYDSQFTDKPWTLSKYTPGWGSGGKDWSAWNTIPLVGSFEQHFPGAKVSEIKPPHGGQPGWDTMPESIPGWARMPGHEKTPGGLTVLPIGTEVSWWFGEKWSRAKKVEDGWQLGTSPISVPAATISKLLEQNDTKGLFLRTPGGVVELNEKWKPLNEPTLADLESFVPGIKIRALYTFGPGLAQKQSDGTWKFENGDVESSSELLDGLSHIKTHHIELSSEYAATVVGGEPLDAQSKWFNPLAKDNYNDSFFDENDTPIGTQLRVRNKEDPTKVQIWTRTANTEWTSTDPQTKEQTKVDTATVVGWLGDGTMHSLYTFQLSKEPVNLSVEPQPGWTEIGMDQKPTLNSVLKAPAGTQWKLAGDTWDQFWRKDVKGMSFWAGNGWTEASAMAFMESLDMAKKTHVVFAPESDPWNPPFGEPAPGVTPKPAAGKASFEEAKKAIDALKVGELVIVGDRWFQKENTQKWTGGKVGNATAFTAITTDALAQTISEAPDGLAAIQALSAPKPPPVAKPKAKKKPPTKSKFTANTTPMSLEAAKNLWPESLHETLTNVFNQADEWSKVPAGGVTPPGAKSPHWPAWVPPAGVFIQGAHGGKKYWLVNTMAGYDTEGLVPMKKIGFAILTEEGKLYSSFTALAGTSSHPNAKKAVEAAALSAAKDIPGFPTSVKGIQEAFGLTKTLFLPGETLKTIKEGSGPSAIPPLEDKAAESMQGDEATQPVKANLTFQQIIEQEYGVDALMPADGLYKYFSVGAKPGESGHDTLNRVAKFFEQHSLPMSFIANPLVTSNGVSFSIHNSMLQQEFVVVMPQKQAASLPKPSDDNWETMPEGVPKTISNASQSQLSELADKVPVGTVFAFGGGGYKKITKTSWNRFDASGKATYDTIAYYSLVHALTGKDIAVSAPNAKVIAQPPPPEPINVKPLQKTKEQLEALAKAKEIGEWAKAHKAIGDKDALHVLAHFQALNPKVKLYARQAPDNELVLSYANPDDGGAWLDMREKLTKQVGGTTQTPLGPFWKVSLADLKSALPGNSADTFTGPDGATYPMGTTFTEKKVEHKVYDLLSTEVQKIVAHKENSDLVMVKVAGVGEEQKGKLLGLLQKHGVEIAGPGVITGGQYTMAPVKKADLYDKVSKVETLTEAHQPEQPPAFLAKPLPSFGGAGRDGEAATINRSDLSMLDTMKLPRSGHWIRCGTYGTFWNGQLRVRKVRDPQGKMHYEVQGQLHDTAWLSGNKLKHDSGSGFRFPDAASTHYPDYQYRQQTYDPETGAQVEVPGGDVIDTYAGLRGETAAGSQIEVCNSSSYPALNGLFRVRIPEGQDVEAQLAEAFQKMNVPLERALAEPGEKDERLFIKHQVVKSLMGTEGMRLKADVVADEAKLDELLKAHNGIKLANAATIERSFNGKQTVMIDDLQKAEKEGARYAYVGVQGVPAMAARIIEGAGLWSNRSKWLNGVKGYASSDDSDNVGGGTLMVFARFGNVTVPAHTDWGYKSSGPKFIIHPRAFRRTDWTTFPTDSYGCWATKDGKGRAYHYQASDHEICFEDGVSMRDIAGVTVNSASDKKKLIAQLVKAGLTEVNGIPLEHFVFDMSGGNNRQNIAASLYGLKPGVLP